jgi:CheY-like chemotaxis protein
MSHCPNLIQQDAIKAASTMKTVLLVDDDPETIEAWTLCMQSQDCKVLSAVDGNGALALLGENLVDIVVSDWKMPGLGGALLCQTMKTNLATAHIPFLMISGHPHPPAFVHYDGYLQKPVEMDALLSAVDRLCAAKRRRPY